jgi:hypothetical protein
MQTLLERLRPAQDLVEVPKRARLDRDAEGREIPLPSATTKNAATH